MYLPWLLEECPGNVLTLVIRGMPVKCITLVTTVLVKSFAHLNRNFFLASLGEIGKFLQW